MGPRQGRQRRLELERVVSESLRAEIDPPRQDAGSLGAAEPGA
jgi:hypothetical protein